MRQLVGQTSQSKFAVSLKDPNGQSATQAKFIKYVLLTQEVQLLDVELHVKQSPVQIKSVDYMHVLPESTVPLTHEVQLVCVIEQVEQFN